ncbi:MAG: class I SAM-dependent methyltransferase [Myxococcales bacterium]|nr:class I SAM-dependent methyltransferase [Myxococcales bacterium]
MKLRPILPLSLLFFAVACGDAQRPEPVTPSAAATAAPTTAGPAAHGAVDHVKVEAPAALRELVAAADRSDADKAMDAGRKPAEMLAFFGIAPGQRVAEIATGTGYTGELLARAVGTGGRVFAHNNDFIVEKFAAKGWAERLATPANANVVKVVRPFEDPLPPEATGLDAVIVNLFYHDTFWFGVDRQKMNAAIAKALKPGGVYGIIDHSGRPGTGSSEAKTLHRVEESEVIKEVTAAGFSLVADADFLRNPNDTRDWSASPGAAGERRGTSDRFVLKFVKP